MAEIPNESVQMICTSPPYYGLRDYGALSQIGLEATVAEYVEKLVNVFREARRVLADDGTLWLNLGDSYAGSWGAQGRTSDGEYVRQHYGRSLSETQIAAHPRKTNNTGSIRDAGLKPKDLIGIPWRVAFALQADGWYLRSDIIWHKPNPMPSSVTDRCTSSHEYVFMLSKSARYLFDADAIREPLAESTLDRINQAKWKRVEQVGSTRAHNGAKTNGPMRAVVNAKGLSRRPQLVDDPDRYNLVGANKRDVWTIATTPYTDAHFATFPVDLPSLCIRAGSRIGDVVLDPFMGSGTTAQAAEALGRRWVGYELNAEYLPLIAKRTRQIGLIGDAR